MRASCPGKFMVLEYRGSYDTIGWIFLIARVRLGFANHPCPLWNLSTRLQWHSWDIAAYTLHDQSRWAGHGDGKVLEADCVLIPVHLHLGRRYTQSWNLASMEAPVLCRKFTTAWTTATFSGWIITV